MQRRTSSEPEPRRSSSTAEGVANDVSAERDVALTWIRVQKPLLLSRVRHARALLTSVPLGFIPFLVRGYLSTAGQWCTQDVRGAGAGPSSSPPPNFFLLIYF